MRNNQARSDAQKGSAAGPIGPRPNESHSPRKNGKKPPVAPPRPGLY